MGKSARQTQKHAKHRCLQCNEIELWWSRSQRTKDFLRSCMFLHRIGCESGPHKSFIERKCKKFLKKGSFIVQTSVSKDVFVWQDLDERVQF